MTHTRVNPHRSRKLSGDNFNFLIQRKLICAIYIYAATYADKILFNYKIACKLFFLTRLFEILTVIARCRRRGRGLGIVAAADFEDDLHVVAGTPTADTPMQVVFGRGADEVVIVARKKLESSGLRRKRPEGDGKVHRSSRLIALRYYPRTGIRYPTRVIFLFGHLQNVRDKNNLEIDVADSIIDATRQISAT